MQWIQVSLFSPCLVSKNYKIITHNERIKHSCAACIGVICDVKLSFRKTIITQDISHKGRWIIYLVSTRICTCCASHSICKSKGVVTDNGLIPQTSHLKVRIQALALSCYPSQESLLLHLSLPGAQLFERWVTLFTKPVLSGWRNWFLYY